MENTVNPLPESSAPDSRTDIVGLDIGHSAVKMTFDGHQGVRRAIFPSLACPAFEIHNPVEAVRSRAETVRVRGRDYFVGETARIQGQAEVLSGLTEAWIESDEHAALVQMARMIVERDARPAANRLWLVGLPVGQFARDRERLGAILKDLLPVNDRVKVLQQPDAAYFAHVYTRDGMPAPNIKPEEESWAIVDIGYYTTDFVLYEQGRYVEAASGRYTGVREIAERIKRALGERGIERGLIDIERAMTRRELLHRGERIDVAPLVQEAVALMFAKVLDESARLLGRRLDTLNGIMVAGGSADWLVAEMVKSWPHARTSQDDHTEQDPSGAKLYGPRFVISEGYYRYGRSSLIVEQFDKLRTKG